MAGWRDYIPFMGPVLDEPPALDVAAVQGEETVSTVEPSPREAAPAPPAAMTAEDVAAVVRAVIREMPAPPPYPKPETPRIIFPVEPMRDLVRGEITAAMREAQPPAPLPAPDPGIWQRAMSMVRPTATVSTGESCRTCVCFIKNECHEGSPLLIMRPGYDKATTAWPGVRSTDWCRRHEPIAS